jgi:riboflavin biosynthesis pyrimidine reductase
MNIPIKIKRGRGRPKKSVINPPEQNIVETSEEPMIVINPPEQNIVETPEEQNIVETSEEPIIKVNPEPVAKQTRKLNRWVEHCTEVKNRTENVGKSYREILKIAKLDYHK